MKTNLIYSHIKHIALRHFSLLFIPLAIIVVSFIHIPFESVFRPKNLTFANSALTMYNSGNEYVEITLKNIKYTGYDHTHNGKIQASYYYSLVENSCTFILVDTSNMKEIPPILNDHTITAKLVPVNSSLKKVLNSFANEIGWTYDGLYDVTSSIVIDETKYNLSFYTYMAVILFLLFIVIISFIIANFIYFLFPWLYPACISFRRISSHGKGIYDVNNELLSHEIFHSGHISLTKNYLIIFTSFHLEIMPIDKIIWTYKHSRWHRILWIKSTLSNSLHFLCYKNTHIYSTRNTKADIDAVLDYFKSKYPDIIIGFSKENWIETKKRMKNKNNHKNTDS